MPFVYASHRCNERRYATFPTFSIAGHGTVREWGGRD